MNAGLHWPCLVTEEIGTGNPPFKGKKIKNLLLRHICTNNVQSHAVKSKKAGNFPPFGLVTDDPQDRHVQSVYSLYAHIHRPR